MSKRKAKEKARQAFVIWMIETARERNIHGEEAINLIGDTLIDELANIMPDMANETEMTRSYDGDDDEECAA
jgi:hypothetical protein